ncbi:MAG: ABC transporter permease [Dethiobacter sp.]|nr:ABC transporter permease [Dethiobacter sp.]MCL5983009.1 ABC transporter permease [Bacillota bacterium]
MLILRRITQTGVVLLGVTVATFLLMHLAPGRPLQANPELRADPTAVERWLQLRELDKPLPAQFFSWLSRLWRGDFGVSLIYNRPVAELVVERLPATILLSGSAFILALSLAMLYGALCAVNRGSRLDRTLNFLSLCGISIPSFWAGMLLLILFSYHLPWLPAAGMRTPGDGSILDVSRHMVLPVLVLSTGIFAYYFRYIRQAVLDVLEQDYIRTARAKGLPMQRIFYRHVLPNVALPLVTLAALSLPVLFTGTVVVETVFAWPGLGRFVVFSAMARDYPAIMFVNLYTALLVALASLLAELLCLVFDPRLKP